MWEKMISIEANLWRHLDQKEHIRQGTFLDLSWTTRKESTFIHDQHQSLSQAYNPLPNNYLYLRFKSITISEGIRKTPF